MTPADALDQLRGALPANPDFHEGVTVPSDAVREVVAALGTHVTDRAPVAREKLLSIEALADLLDVPVLTIRKWRAQGTGPRGLRVGKYVRYRPEDVKLWLDELAKA